MLRAGAVVSPLDTVNPAARPVVELQTGDTPSYLKFSNISYINWSGTTAGKALVKIACSANARCGGISFKGWNVTVAGGGTGTYACANTLDVTGIPNCSYTE
ncbi:glycoside hydrolase family 28 protein [Athelia psychrophila]|uniref:Glycoside hydrolase family 28 protein n=1 Tax=Athelia psychrophila TaxID=1759441 RepID=A0A166TKJ8_9AGAM|nr:glycoside hydrolase family 28 protein [Fibularhizoctonia sp. CBS 109695]